MSLTVQNFGWLEDVAKENFRLFSDTIPRYTDFKGTSSTYGPRRMLHEYVRQLLGKDFVHYAQQIGDCTSFGARHTTLFTYAAEIIAKGESERFQDVFPPYTYGAGRVLIGNRPWFDGSTGDWTRQAMEKNGVLFTDVDNVPPYSGSIARQWGRSGPPDNFVSIATPHHFNSTSLISSAEQVAQSIWEGYAVNVCSNYGFEMQARNGLFNRARGTWAHSMCIYGYEVHPQYGLYFLVKNSWDASAHGILKDFQTGEDLPVCTLRVLADIIDAMVRQNDSYNYSSLAGYPDNSSALNKADFRVLGS